MKLILMVFSILLLGVMTACKQLLPASSQAVSQSVAVAASTEIAHRVIEAAPQFTPYLQLKDFEICIENADMNYECQLVVSKKKRTITADQINLNDSALIRKEAMLYLLSELKVFCDKSPETCKKIGKDYSNIRRIYVF